MEFIDITMLMVVLLFVIVPLAILSMYIDNPKDKKK